MACACKNKFNKMKKYSDGSVKDIAEEKQNIFLKILQILLQICFGIFCGVVIIIMIVPMLLYIIGSLIIGKDVTFNLKRYGKVKNKNI